MSTLAEARLYGIIDLGYCTWSETPNIATQMIESGVDFVQLRAKNLSLDQFAQLAAQLAPLFSSAGIPFILNDHPQLVVETGATGAHVGQDDISVAEARRLAGPDAIIGKSTHSFAQAREAAAPSEPEEKPDYIGFGPLFATPTKPDYVPIGLEEIRKVHEAVTVPIFCIGGVKLENLEQIIAAGARRVVIVSGLLQAADLSSYARKVKKLLE